MNTSSTNIKPESGLLSNFLLLPSRLCIDAPLVAVFWSTAIEFLRNGSIAEIAPHISLFLAVWVIYLFDRLYDCRPGLPEQRNSLRHQFARRNRRLHFSLLFATIAGCMFMFLSGYIDRFFLQWGALIGASVFLYFAVFRFFKSALKTTRIPMKEITIGLCFSAGVCLASGAIELARFLPLGALFSLNCLIISRSESGEDARSDPAAFFSTNRKLPYLEICVAIIAATFVWSLENHLLFRVAIMVSTLLLITLTLFGRRSPSYTQALADASLLTVWPVIWISFPG